MSFHIDIIPVIDPDGSKTYLESDYSIDECVKEGWLDPTVPGGLWVREVVDKEHHLQDGYTAVPNMDWTDSMCGRNMGLNFVKTDDGRWVHEESNGMRLR